MSLRRLAFAAVVLALMLPAAGLIAPHDPYTTGLRPPAEAPGALIFGADTLGRDVFSRVLHGAAPTIGAGGLAALLAWGVGAVFGVLGNLRRLASVVDILIMALLALPSFFVALILVTGLGSGLLTAAASAGLAQAVIAGQVWRGAIYQTRRETYIEAAYALGATSAGVMLRHILPNVLPVLAAYGCTLFASSILLISSLSFLGLGGEPASPDWGNMLAEGRAAIRYAPHIMLLPALALMLVTGSLTLLSRMFSPRG